MVKFEVPHGAHHVPYHAWTTKFCAYTVRSFMNFRLRKYFVPYFALKKWYEFVSDWFIDLHTEMYVTHKQHILVQTQTHVLNTQWVRPVSLCMRGDAPGVRRLRCNFDRGLQWNFHWDFSHSVCSHSPCSVRTFSDDVPIFNVCLWYLNI